MNIGDKILELRKSKGYSQEDIANKLNVSRQTISKWETNQSTPDFDKIVPLCQLFGITTDELLMNKQVNEFQELVEKNEDVNNINEVKMKNRKKFALNLCLSILIYFVSVMWIIFAEYAKIDEDLSVVVFLGLAGIATVIIVYASIVNRDSREEKVREKLQEKKEENPLVNSIIGILGLVFTVIYLLISFYTMAWHITWILWIVYGIVVDIVKLVFKLEGKDE